MNPANDAAPGRSSKTSFCLCTFHHTKIDSRAGINEKAMATLKFDNSRFLDFSSVPRAPPKLFVTAETSDFDEITLQQWRDEGFDVEYLPLENEGGQKAYLESLKRLYEGLGVSDYYGIVGRVSIRIA